MTIPISLINSLGWHNNLSEPDTLLHKSAHAGDLEEIRNILTYDENVRLINQKNRLGCSPLRLAATGGHADVLSYLILYGADVNLVDIKHQTPLFVAVKRKHLNCVRILLRAGANPDGDRFSLCTPLYIAAMEGFYSGVCELIKGGADLNKSQITNIMQSSSPLHISAIYGYYDCFHALISAGADPGYNTKGRTIYHSLAVYDSDVKFVDLLYQSGANVYVKNNSGRFAHEIYRDNPTCSFIKFVFSNPRPLMSQCRIAIRQFVGVKRLSRINDELPLPKILLDYLQFR